MAWLKVESRYPRHPKTRRIGLEAMALDIAGMCHAREFNTEGLILDTDLDGIAPAPVAKLRKLAGALTDANRWERDDAIGGWWIHGFSERNPTEEEDEEAAVKRSEKAKKAATARWSKPDAASNAPSIAQALLDRNARAVPPTPSSSSSKNAGAMPNLEPKHRDVVLWLAKHAEGIDVDGVGLTKADWSRIGKCAKTVLEASPNVTEREVISVVGRYRDRNQGANVTANAIAEWWTRLISQPTRRTGFERDSA